MKVFIPIAIALGAIVLTTTNPSEAAYTTWAAKRFSTNLKTRVCHEQAFPEALQGKGVSDACKSSVNLLRQSGLPKVAIGIMTQRQNFVLFSIYTTKTPERTYRVVGACGYFLSL